MICNKKLRELLKERGIPQTVVADALSIKPNNLARYDDLQKRSIEDIAIISRATGIDISDLIGVDVRIDLNSTKSNLPARGVPYFDDMECTGTILSMYTDIKEQPAFYIDYAHFNDCTAYVPVVGDSMYPNYCSGEIVAVKQINNLDVIQWGESYLVVTNDNANNLRTIKQIHYCEDESKIILRASNPNFRGDTVIPKEDIVSLFIIKGKIKRNQL